MEISNTTRVIHLDPENHIYQISKKLILSKKESDIVDEELEKVFKGFNYEVGTNEIRFFINLKKESKTEISDIKSELKVELQSIVLRAKERLEKYLEKVKT